MARTKLTAHNYCHTPIKGGAAVEDLITAAKKGRQACIDHLAGRHPDDVRSDNGIGVLHALVRSGSGTKAERAAMDVLLALGANVNARNLRGQTPLLSAANAGSWWVISRFRNAGADIAAVDNQGSAVSDVMSGWLERHPDKEDQTQELKAWMSYCAMGKQIDPAPAGKTRPGPRL